MACLSAMTAAPCGTGCFLSVSHPPRHTASCLGPTGLHGPQATWGCLCGPPAAHCCHSVFLLLCPSEQRRFIFTITVSAPTPGKFETKFYVPFAYVYAMLCACISIGAHRGQKRVRSRVPGTRIKGHCELCNLEVGIWTLGPQEQYTLSSCMGNFLIWLDATKKMILKL